MKTLSPNKDMQQLINKALNQGWDVARTKSNHLKWSSPSGDCFVSASTPSDHRAIKYVKQYLRKYGFLENGGKK